jgi:putative ABC transport system permease protein
MNDLKYAFRQFRKHPGFTAVAVLTLGFGIGANTAMFSFVNAILLRGLPYAKAERLMMVFENHVTNGWSKVDIEAPVLEEWRRQNTVFEGLGAVRRYGNFTLTGRGQPETLSGSLFSANVFSLLGIQPCLGRGFLPEEETFGNHRVVLLSFELWQRRFGGARDILGQTLTLAAEPYTVVGVMPPRTISPDGARFRDVWLPLAFTPEELRLRHSHNYSVIGRLKPGATLEQARAEMSLIAQRMAAADAQNGGWGGWGAEVYPLHEIIVGNTERLLLVLLGSVGLVLLIACANIASLLLARSAARTREFAIRAALGAGRAALLRQLLLESAVLAGAGGLLGIFIAWGGLAALIHFSPPDLPRMAEGIPLDALTLGFTATLTLTVGVLCGLMPAWQASNPVLARELGETTRGSSSGPGRQFIRAVLVTGELALSVLLLVGAGLTVRSFNRLLAQNPGFVPEHLMTIALNLPDRTYPGQAERARLFDALLTAVRAIPGVHSASCAFGVPLTSINSSLSVTVRDAPPPAPGESVAAGYGQVSPGYFATMKTTLLQGRDFTEMDNTNTPAVVIVDETFTKQFKLGAQPAGRRLDIGDGTRDVEIIGVVNDVKRVGLAGAYRGEMYRPYRQVCWGYMTLVVRSQREPSDVARAIRIELDRFDRDLPFENVRTMTQLVAANVAQRRLSTQLLTGFAVGALLLSALGLYGVLAYMVTQRTREIGIRLALGARRRDVVRLVIGQGMHLALLGIAFGLVGALALSRLLQRLLYEIKPNDTATFILVPSVLALVALLACWLPARRAARVDPIEALRHE